MKIENISFSKEGYEKFKALSKKEQIEFVTERLNPKDPERAEKLLTHIPNGYISEGNGGQIAKDNATGLAKEDRTADLDRPETEAGEERRVSKRK